jgi:hypothetical protein
MINSHLMPGKMVIKQEMPDLGFFTTKDLTLGTGSNITLVANRDHNGAATGKIYIDDGINITQPESYYELLLSSNSIKKW